VQTDSIWKGIATAPAITLTCLCSLASCWKLPMVLHEPSSRWTSIWIVAVLGTIQREDMGVLSLASPVWMVSPVPPMPVDAVRELPLPSVNR